MDKLKKVIAMVLVAGAVALGLAGCKNDNQEHPSNGAPAQEHPSKGHEHPAGEHPK